MKKLTRPLTLSLLSLSLALPVFAAEHYKGEVTPTNPPSWLYMGAYGGYGDVSGAYENDGQFTQGRLAFGVHTTSYPRFSFGAETGVQWGNDMRFSTSDAIIDDAGGLPIQTTLKPLVDLLLTAKVTSNDYPCFAVLKGGVAYRQLQFMDRTSPGDSLRKVNAEVQAGLGYNLTEHAAVTLFYQGIYSGSNAGISLDSTNNGVLLSRIPTQQAGFLGLEYNV